MRRILKLGGEAARGIKYFKYQYTDCTSMWENLNDGGNIVAVSINMSLKETNWTTRVTGRHT